MTQEFVTLPREVLERALEAMSLALSDVDWRKDSPTQPVIHKAYNATCAALEQPQNHVFDAGNMVPSGWKLVPVEPTQEMLDQLRFGWSDISTAQIIDRWKRTVDAAPQPPTTEDCSVVEPPQGEQEPVAWAVMQGGAICWEADYPFSNEPGWCDSDQQSVPLYTRPQPKREPLTDEAVLGVAKSIEIQFDSERLNEQIDDILAFARAIEAAHNIK